MDVQPGHRAALTTSRAHRLDPPGMISYEAVGGGLPHARKHTLVVVQLVVARREQVGVELLDECDPPTRTR